MRASRVVPVMAATAAVLVATTTAGGARPEGGVAQDRPGPGVVAAASAQNIDPLVLLYALSDERRVSGLRFEVCTLPDSPDPRRTAFRIDVKTPAEPVDTTCLNVAVPTPETADTPAGTGTDREPTTAADQDYGAVTVAATNPRGLDLVRCLLDDTTILGIGSDFSGCEGIPISG
jgi:hypothetical protein